jgi:hypothetical protein
MNCGVSVLIPSRQRPKRLTATIESINKTKVGEVEVLTYVDDDDPEKDKYQSPSILGPRINLSAAHYALEKIAKNYYLLMAADDIIFKTKGWDEKMKNAMPEDGIGVVFTNDGWKNSPNHCLYTKRLSELVGCIYPLEFEHFGMDTYFTDCMKGVGRFIHLPEILIEHHHFRNGKADQDDTYRYPRDNMANQRDTQRLNEFRKSRMPRDVAILKAEIERFRSAKSPRAVAAA